MGAQRRDGFINQMSQPRVMSPLCAFFPALRSRLSTGTMRAADGGPDPQGSLQAGTAKEQEREKSLRRFHRDEQSYCITQGSCPYVFTRLTEKL